MFPDGDGVTIQPGGSFELHSGDGLVDSFDDATAAAKRLYQMKDAHQAHVERGGPDALKAKWPKGVAFPALKDAGDPGLEVRMAGTGEVIELERPEPEPEPEVPVEAPVEAVVEASEASTEPPPPQDPVVGEPEISVEEPPPEPQPVTSRGYY